MQVSWLGSAAGKGEGGGGRAGTGSQEREGRQHGKEAESVP